jgi:hypothetical protein
VSIFIDTLRAAEDNGFGIVAYKELSPYQVFLVNVINDQVNFNDSAATRVRTDTQITVGTGVGLNLNPHIQYLVKMDTNQVSVLAGAALTDMEIMLGPLAFPYNTGYQSGGFDPANFQPGPTSANNTQIYVHILGEGMNQINGNYFKVNEVVLNGMDNIFYYVKLTAIQDVIS